MPLRATHYSLVYLDSKLFGAGWVSIPLRPVEFTQDLVLTTEFCLDLTSKTEKVFVLQRMFRILFHQISFAKSLFFRSVLLKKNSFTLTFIYFSARVMLLELIYFLLHFQQGACSFFQMCRSIFLQQSGGQDLHLSISLHGKGSGKIHALSSSCIFCGGSCCFSYCVL